MEQEWQADDNGPIYMPFNYPKVAFCFSLATRKPLPVPLSITYASFLFSVSHSDHLFTAQSYLSRNRLNDYCSRFMKYAPFAWSCQFLDRSANVRASATSVPNGVELRQHSLDLRPLSTSACGLTLQASLGLYSASCICR